MDDGVVEVWRADLATADDALATLLSPKEVERAARIVRARDGERWARARGILRALLGTYLDADPGALRLAAGRHGKPKLVGPRSPLCFNLSHSGDVALYAFAHGRSVGVDVEVGRRRRTDAAALAKRMFGAEEARRLSELEPEARVQEFLQVWVRREAELKCRGTGLGGPSAGPDAPAVWIADLDVGPGAAAAVAVEGPACEVRRHEWPPG